MEKNEPIDIRAVDWRRFASPRIDAAARRLVLAGSLFLLSLASNAGATSTATDYRAVIHQVRALVEHEVRQKHLPGFSVALIDDQRIVWSQGFGFADPDRKVSASADTVYRVGSVSKLFTDIAIMQLVERGQLDLDAPITKYLPTFRPKDPFNVPITLRELMTHRAGLVREPPVGNYFDGTEPPLEAVVRSLNNTRLVYKPGTHTKYSNAGDSVAGLVLERLAHEPYAQYLQHAVLSPLALEDSTFAPKPALQPKLATGYMWTYDGREFKAPKFQLGTGPAGNLYSTVLDLARFLSAIFADGQGTNGSLLKSATLQEMFAPQFPDANGQSAFGLGFALNSVQGHQVVGHRGGIYGFSSEVLAMPNEKLGAVVLTNMDGSTEITWHVAYNALLRMFAAKSGSPLPPLKLTQEIPPALVRQLAGRYGDGRSALTLAARNDRLYVEPAAGRIIQLRQYGDELITDDRNGWGWEVIPATDGIKTIGNSEQLLRRVPSASQTPMPESWRALTGEYGWAYNSLSVLYRNNELTALLEMEYNPLTRISGTVWEFPEDSSYDGERLTFVLDKHGCAVQAKVGEVVFPAVHHCLHVAAGAFQAITK